MNDRKTIHVAVTAYCKYCRKKEWFYVAECCNAYRPLCLLAISVDSDDDTKEYKCRTHIISLDRDGAII